MTKHKARVVYNNMEDSFDVEIYSHIYNNWGLDTRYYCCHSKEYNNAEAEFIPWKILHKIRDMVDMGYEVNLCGTWIQSRK